MLFKVFVRTPPDRKFHTAPIMGALSFLVVKLMTRASEKTKTQMGNIGKLFRQTIQN